MTHFSLLEIKPDWRRELAREKAEQAAKVAKAAEHAIAAAPAAKVKRGAFGRFVSAFKEGL